MSLARLQPFGQWTIINEMTLQFLVEVSGCPTACMHCWALGGDYGAMPIEPRSMRYR